MQGHDIVVIGGSAGAFEALRRLCAELPSDLPAAVFVVVHISPSSRSMMPELLSRVSSLKARHPVDGESIRPGGIYVAPPDHHLLLQPGKVLLRRGPHENRTRPAIDPLFRSAAIAYGSRVIGLVLSGLQDDGSEGLIAIKLCGGLCLVQQPSDALWPEMPRNAMARDHVDHCLPVAEMAGLIARLVREPPGPERPVPQNLMVEAQIAAQETPVSPEHTTLGSPSPLSCPQCGGVLNEVNAEGSTRFRCQIGHGFTADGLLAAQNDELERALESAIRIHRDRVALFRRLQQKTLPAMPLAAARWKTSAEESEHAARLIEGALKKMRHGPEEPSAKPAPVQDSHIPVQDSRIEGC